MTIKKIMTTVAASCAAMVIAAAPAMAKPQAGMDAKCQAMMAEKQT